MFLPFLEDGDVDDEDGPESKKVKIEASFCLVVVPEEKEEKSKANPFVPTKQDIFAILKDKSMTLGRKKVSFLTKTL
jgi:hypothetical protein